jgi:putrescine aminotransferase
MQGEDARPFTPRRRRGMLSRQWEVRLVKRGMKDEIVERFARHINRGQVGYLRAGHLDVIETERHGAGFVDLSSERSMLDCFTSAGCFNVGRSNARIRSALQEGLKEYGLGEPGDDSKPKRAVRKRLAKLAPGDIDGVILAAGGGDAVDMAIKLARAATGRSQIMSTHLAYHGHTGFALSANGKAHYREYAEPLMPGFSFVPFGDLEAMRRVAGQNTAAILIEPVQGEAGIFIGTASYLQGLRQLSDELGCLLIFDEIQTGFGRTGKFFACEHSGVVPDLMTVAKSMGGGLYPSAALLYRKLPAVVDFLGEHPDFHPTTGGADLGCVVSLAVMDSIEEEGLCQRAEVLGARLRGALEELKGEYPRIIKEVRGLGLMVGIEYIHEFLGPMMSDALARNGIFAAYSGNAPQVMRFMPPPAMSDEEMERLIAGIRAAVADMQTLLPVAMPAARIPVLRKLLNDERVQTRLFGALRTTEDILGRLPLSLLRRRKS